MGMMDKMMEFMASRMSKEDKDQMMDKMMEEFFAGMSAEDKQKMMEEMMPKMMEGVNMMEMMPKMMMSMMGGSEGEGEMTGMMSKMMGGEQETGMPMMPQMMMNMMPECLNMMLPNLPKDERIEFAAKVVTALVERGSEGMTEEEKSDYIGRMIEQVTRAGALSK